MAGFCVAVAVAMTLTGPAAAGAAGNPTGSAAEIHLYAKGVAHMNGLVGWVQTTHGEYYWGYSGANWRLDVGGTTAPHPFEHAVNDVQTLGLGAGKVKWELNQFVCPSAGGCDNLGSLSIYGSARGVYFGTTTRATGLPYCWRQASGSTQWMVSDFSPGWTPWSESTGAGYTAQHYVSMTRHGAREVFTSTYTATATATHYTEVDTLDTSTLDFVAATYRVAAIPGRPAYSFATTFAFPSAAPTPPVLTMCETG